MRNTLLLTLVLCATTASAGTLRGRVTDATGGALPGVTIEIAKQTFTTDANGEYSANVDDGAQTVVFRLIDFATLVRTSVAVPGTLDVVLPLQTSAEILVTGRNTFRNLADIENADALIGVADTASSGVVTASQIESRALQRPGDVLETVPGVVVSQHSGEGKANQYYLRGFNLDHGTDLATFVAGAPVNMPTHAHGHGYTDVAFLIPELISGVQYTKGPYSAERGDFASAGAIDVHYANSLDAPLVSLTGGGFGYERVLAAGSRAFRSGILLGAVEVAHNDGPWKRPDNYRKVNALLRYTGGDDDDAFSLTMSAYRGRWSATDQIPARAPISRFGAIDTSDGGDSHRYAATAEWQRRTPNALVRANGYVIGYGLDLFSNFTYFLDDPVNGDQFEQLDRRVVAGGRVSRTSVAGRFENHAGIDARHDRIGALGLFHTRDRKRLETIRDDRVRQTSAGVYDELSARWTPYLRTVTGLRADAYRFDARTASIVSPKVSAIFGPWRATELYVSAGTGFHSNDARAQSALVRTRGAELGVRSMAIPRLQTTVAAWALDMDSELVFVGDAGATEAGMASRRVGVEWTNYWRAHRHLVVDADLAWSRARFRNGDRIPGAVEGVVAAGIALEDLGRFSGSLRWRFLGPRPLIEDDSVRARRSSLFTAEAGYEITPRMRVVVEALNLTNARVSDVDYFYASRLPGESLAGVEDVHTHPVEPRSVRVTFGLRWP